MSERNTGNPTVAAIKAKKRNSVVVVLSNGEKYSLSSASYTDLRLYEGKELSSEEMDVLTAFTKEDEYYEYALSLLSREIYTSYVLRNKLRKKGARDDVADSVVDRLISEGIVDDARYAKTYAEDISDFRQYGKAKTIRKLKEKGVSEEILNKIEFPQEKELEKAIRFCEVLDKRYAKYPNAKKMHKARQAMIEKGYDFETADEAISQVLSLDSGTDEKEKLRKDFYAAVSRYDKLENFNDRKKKIFAYLVRKGYHYEDINEIMEEYRNEDR